MWLVYHLFANWSSDNLEFSTRHKPIKAITQHLTTKYVLPESTESKHWWIINLNDAISPSTIELLKYTFQCTFPKWILENRNISSRFRENLNREYDSGVQLQWKMNEKHTKKNKAIFIWTDIVKCVFICSAC